MGNARSVSCEPVYVDPWWNNVPAAPRSMADDDTLSTLHEKRLRIIAEKKKEMDGLREEVARKNRENEEMKELLRKNGLEPPLPKMDAGIQTETFEVPGVPPEVRLDEELSQLRIIKDKNLHLQVNIAELQKELQAANADLAAFENERKEYKTHVAALKDIITVSKQLLLMRESQIKELAQKVDEIQASLADRELRIFSDNLKEEYERQLQKIKQLRVLYEERQMMDRRERDSLKAQLEEAQASAKNHETKNSELQERIAELEKSNSDRYEKIVNLESQLGLSKAECGELRAEISVINQLFSHILMGFNNSQEIDLDQLIKILAENHDLLTDIVGNEESSEVSSALPKVLLDLVRQMGEKTKSQTNNSSESSQEAPSQNLGTATDIVRNLSKVWKVLVQLLSHHAGPSSVLNELSDQNPCYKSVQTPTGPTLVLSVSKTFIRLKNLIVEKKSLEKETMRLKYLNTHLESRLQDQEKRLETVSQELSKTWHLVGKMQKQHQQLHTQEKILRYELAQKRKLLTELKEELEYCREKWMQAREKNSTTEEQWKQLRNEFAARKDATEDLNNSVESGYSDERESSEDEDIRVVAEAPTTILAVIQNEIAKIESSVSNEATKSSEGSDNDAHQEDGTEVHSDATLKTDLVQKTEKDTESQSDAEKRRNSEDEDKRRKDIDDTYKKLEENILQTIKKTQSGEYPSTSKQTRTAEEVLAAREERFKRLEQLSSDLASQETRTSHKSVEVSSQLDDLHQHSEEPSSETSSEASSSKQPSTEEEVETAPQIPEEATSTALSPLGDESPSQDTGEGTSQQDNTPSTSRSPDEILARREERLQRMEEQAQQLMRRAIRNSVRSLQFSRRLSNLHERYGESTDSDEATEEETSPPEDSPEESAE